MNRKIYTGENGLLAFGIGLALGVTVIALVLLARIATAAFKQDEGGDWLED